MRGSFIRLLVVALAAGGAVAAVPASAAEGGMCKLDGSATFVKGPNTTDHPFTYTFTGDLTSCQSNVAGAPASGKIATVEPAKGSGTCGSNSTAGVALVTWADGKTTVVKYSTQSATAGVVLQGSVVPSYKVKKTTYKTTRFAGYSAAGPLAFEASPPECAGGGVTTAGIAGFVGLGTQ
ncbi:MAG: hypothetical protein QOE99_111 [Actinomycetota bacterium]|jgi:hypothetical protein|nr:hypothetical protein [Actinomycetota bacterium]